MNTTRSESDSFGSIEVPSDVLWGAQTARSMRFFAIGEQRMPIKIIYALAWIKGVAATVNSDLELLDASKAQVIAGAAQRIVAGEFDAQFPLSVWQTGSGTQTNMNVNEVLANLASQALGGDMGDGRLVHPNDDVNMGQSSNDVFPTAMHIAVALQAQHNLFPALHGLRIAMTAKILAFEPIVKIGRTHMQDATPVTFGQEFSGYEAQLALCEKSLRYAMHAVHTLAIGGTAVGTGVNTHPEFGTRVASGLAARLNLPLVQADNLFAAMAGHEALVAFHAAAKMLAIALTKIANDIRLMGSGPRGGLGELRLPENEPGSSIMPGKVNPTQIEAITMVCAQVMGHDVAVGLAASQGHFELNVYKPLIASNILDSIVLLSDAMRSFTQHCVVGIEVNETHVAQQVQGSLMLVTALTPHIGYDLAAKIAKHAYANKISLREAALAIADISEEQFDFWVNPRNMLGSQTNIVNEK